MALSAGTAYVDILPRTAAGFQGAMSGMLKSPLGKAGLVAGGAAVAGVAAGVAVGVKSINAFADLETGMNEVFTLLPDISQGAMDDMTQQVQDFSRDFGVLPNDVVPALYQSISAGVPKDNVFEFLETAQKAAKGGVTDLTTAVDGISSVVNAYGEDVIGAGEASDLMFTAVRLGKTTFDEMSSSLFQVIPTASALGVEFGDVTAALATMTAQGTPTSVATTQLRQLFVELSKSGSAASDAFTDIAGKPFSQFVSEGGNVAEALELMETAAGDNGVALQDMFGSVEAGAAALSLTGSDAFTDNLAEMGSAAGATDAAYEQMDQGLSRTWEKVKATFAVALTEIGERLAPFVQTIGDFIADHLPGAIDTFIAFIGPFIDIIGGALESVSGIFGGVSDGVSETSGVIGTVVEYLTGVFTFVRTVITDVFNAVRDVIANNSDKIRNIIEGVAGVFSRLAEVATAIFGFLQAFWDEWGGVIIAIFSLVFGNVINILSGAFDVIVGIFDFVLGVLSGDWERAWNGIKQIFSGVIDTIIGIVENVATFLTDIWHHLFGNGIIVDFVRDGLNNIVNFFAELPGRIFGFLADLPGRFLSLGADLVAGLLSGLGDIVGRVGSKIKDGISGAINNVKGFFGIGSPSKVFAAEIGGPLLEGILAPFTHGDRAVAGAITSTVTSGAKAGANAAGRALAHLDGAAGRRVTTGVGAVADTDTTVGDGMTFNDGAIVIQYPEKEPASTAIPRELRKIQFTNSRG